MQSFFQRVGRTLLGRPDFANLDQRLVNVMCLGGAAIVYIAAIENFLIGIGWFMTITSCIQATILLSCYIYSTVTGKYRFMIWPVLLSILGFLSFQWFYNAGSMGGAQYFIFICSLIGAIVVTGWQRILIVALYIVAANTVLYIEYTRPELVSDYPDRGSRYFDIAFSFTVCLIMLGIFMGVLARHYDELVRRVKRQSDGMVEDLQLARMLQQEIFKHDPARTIGFDCSILYTPSAAVGGDFYDVTPTGKALRILLADLKGHGVSAALSSMLVKSEWVHSGHQAVPPGAALTILNRILIQRYPSSIILSAILIDVYPDRVEYSSAGHPVQYVCGNTCVPLRSAGVPLGISDDYIYKTSQQPLESGSRIVLFTDALVEQFDHFGRSVGYDWLEDTLSKKGMRSDTIRDSILHRFHSLTGKRPGETIDDLTIIVLGTNT